MVEETNQRIRIGRYFVRLDERDGIVKAMFYLKKDGPPWEYESYRIYNARDQADPLNYVMIALIQENDKLKQ